MDLDAFVEAAKLTDDPAFRIDMLANLSEVTPFEQREPKLRDVVAAIEQSGLDQWRLPDALSELAAILRGRSKRRARPCTALCSMVDPTDPTARP